MADIIFTGGISIGTGISITPPPPSAPDAPTVGTATATGSTTATVTFTAPAYGGTSTITSYTATSSPGNITGTLNQAGSGTITVSGLTAGTSYTFTVTATNSVGTSSASSASNSITTYTVPGAPTVGTATATGTTTATVAFTQPASNGGSTITSYTATSSPGGITGTLSQAGSGTITVTGLTASTSYTFTVTATNSIGTSSPSASSNSITTASPRLGGLIGGLGMTGQTTNNVYGASYIGYDSSGNFYILGSSGASSYDVILAKYNSAGVIQWQKTFDNGANDNAYFLSVDSSGNSYFTINSGQPMYVMKVDTNGSITWQRKLLTTGLAVYAICTSIDSSGNVYVGGTWANGNTEVTSCLTIKYNSSGVLQWQRQLGPVTGSSAQKTVTSKAISVDNSGNVVILGQGSFDGVAGTFFAAKYNSSGTLQWQKRIYDGGAYYGNTASGMKIDSAGNIIIVGTTGIYGIQIVFKLDSTGTNILWQKTLGGPPYSNYIFTYAVDLDSSDNIYVAAQGPEGAYIIKYNSSGTLQWQNSMSGFGSFSGISVNSTNNTLFVTGAGVFAKLPTDGSMYGTYTLGAGSYTYAAGTQTAGLGPTWTTPTTTSSYPDIAGAVTDSAGSTPIANSAYSTSTTTLT